MLPGWPFPVCPRDRREWKVEHRSGMTLFSSEQLADVPSCSSSARKMLAEAPGLQINRKRRDPLGRQAPKHLIDTLRWQLRPAVEPPGQHSHVGANDVLDDKFARDGVRGILADGCRKFIPHQIRKYLANLAKADGATAAADERPIVVHMVTGMFEHGQAEAQASVLNVSGRRLSFSLPIDELLAQLLEAPPL